MQLLHTMLLWSIACEIVYPKSTRVLRFLISGGLASLVALVLLYTFTEFCGIVYWRSNVLAAAGSSVFNFFLQREWTFRGSNPDRAHRQFYEFAAKSAFLSTLDIVLLPAFVEYTGIWYLWVKIGLLPPLAVVSYFVSHFIFHRL